MMMNEVKIENYTNLWGEIDRIEVKDEIYCLMENNTWGDETEYLVIRVPHTIQKKQLKNGKIVDFIPFVCVICETFDTLESALIDEDIIKEEA